MRLLGLLLSVDEIDASGRMLRDGSALATLQKCRGCEARWMRRDRRGLQVLLIAASERTDHSVQEARNRQPQGLRGPEWSSLTGGSCVRAPLAGLYAPPSSTGFAAR
jgi:hypothetical protein